LLNIKSSWRGKYTQVNRHSNWGGGESRSWDSTYKNGYKTNTFIIPPKGAIKFQFVVGEDKAKINTKIKSAYIVPKEYAEKLFEALDEKNMALVLIDKFLQDERISAFHNRLKRTKQNIINAQNKALKEAYKDEVDVSIILPQNYDRDFGGDVTIKVITPKPMCIYVDTDFGVQKIFADGSVEKIYKGVQDLSPVTSVHVRDIKQSCD
jgi:hypothetical protein